jgi:hypothetical protein
VLVAAHGNSLRAIVKHLFDVPDAEIVHVEIPTGNPLVIDLDADLKPVARAIWTRARAEKLPGSPGQASPETLGNSALMPKRAWSRSSPVLGLITSPMSAPAAAGQEYRRLTQYEVDVICAKHDRLWSARLGGARAVFAFCDLSGLSVTGRNLCDADFTGALLVGCDMRKAKLDNANMYGADMQGADLTDASMRRATCAAPACAAPT